MRVVRRMFIAIQKTDIIVPIARYVKFAILLSMR